MDGNSYAALHRSMAFPRRRPSRLRSPWRTIGGSPELPASVGAANTRGLSGENRGTGRRCSQSYEFFPVDGTPGTTGASGPIHTARPSHQNTAYWPSLRLRSSASATARFRTSRTMSSCSCPSGMTVSNSVATASFPAVSLRGTRPAARTRSPKAKDVRPLRRPESVMAELRQRRRRGHLPIQSPRVSAARAPASRTRSSSARALRTRRPCTPWR